ncbi:protein RALF-like 19 [Magnolia sinica]|uniref:protein RALF-like 19 n=1 Tax=Magnolia sinica TaxID=86752 RepID=UPI00265A2D17|nr:protein RALF-like 19 [Magnolia sinica]
MSFSYLKTISLALLILASHVLYCKGARVMDHPPAWKGHDMDVVVKRGGCMVGGDCMWDEEVEMEMDSDINRRILAVQKKYISYDLLKKDEVPCSRPGASYYDCHELGKANPYQRGCTVITGCARDTRS